MLERKEIINTKKLLFLGWRKFHNTIEICMGRIDTLECRFYNLRQARAKNFAFNLHRNYEIKDGFYFLGNNKLYNRYKIKCKFYYGFYYGY